MHIRNSKWNYWQSYKQAEILFQMFLALAYMTYRIKENGGPADTGLLHCACCSRRYRVTIMSNVGGDGGRAGRERSEGRSRWPKQTCRQRNWSTFHKQCCYSKHWQNNHIVIINKLLSFSTNTFTRDLKKIYFFALISLFLWRGWDEHTPKLWSAFRYIYPDRSII